MGRYVVWVLLFSFRNLIGATLVHKENNRTTEKCKKSAKINKISKVCTAQVSQLEFGGREAKPHPKDEVLVKAGTPPTEAAYSSHKPQTQLRLGPSDCSGEMGH